MRAVDNNLAALRRKRGLSAVALAEAAGVTRQTIYAMEAGTYVPNTAVALRMARALDSSVEDLFVLAAEETAPRRATLLRGAGVPEAGAVQLCMVDRRLMASVPSPLPWWLPVADGALTDKKGHVRMFGPGGDFANRILIAGCDPAISVLSRHAGAAGIELVPAHRNSTEALALLKQGCVHVAGTHLHGGPGGTAEDAKSSLAVISFAVWEEGIVTAPGNPKGIRGLEDFARADIGIVNREKGSGSRALLDAGLKRLGIKARTVTGYANSAAGHLPAAWQVHSGTADCCLATRAAARAFGLHFIPLATRRYDLVVHRRHLELPRVQHLFETLGRSGFRRELEGLGGYDTGMAGQRVV